MKPRRPLLRIVSDRLHIGLASAVIALLAYGSLMVWTATVTMVGHTALVQRQFIGIALGCLFLIGAWLIDYTQYKSWTGPLMILLCALILSPRIPGLGGTASGATSWLEVFGVRLFQPSEPAKLLFIVVLAAVVAEFGGKIERRTDVLRVTGYVALPFVLILLQPDLGTGLVFIMIALGMLLVGGLKGRWFAVAAVLIVVFAVAGLTTPLLQQYQKDRLLVFVDPSRDPKGAGYNLAQSKIAIGSGGMTGTGLAAGTQSRFNFIPEPHTDFIFSVLGEQFGFVGAIMLLALYLALLSATLSISASSRDLYGALIAAGLLSMWLFQILENVGMTIGIMPVTGIPLPFMSYGSSFMVTNLAGVGILLSIWSRRYGTGL
ncbi:MAG TPA: rod shape-determining protein RodA [Coriobacteriia bacterium]|jgi:rod shape determining protein RodA